MDEGPLSKLQLTAEFLVALEIGVAFDSAVHRADCIVKLDPDVNGAKCIVPPNEQHRAGAVVIGAWI